MLYWQMTVINANFVSFQVLTNFYWIYDAVAVNKFVSTRELSQKLFGLLKKFNQLCVDSAELASWTAGSLNRWWNNTRWNHLSHLNILIVVILIISLCTKVKNYAKSCRNWIRWILQSTVGSIFLRISLHADLGNAIGRRMSIDAAPFLHAAFIIDLWTAETFAFVRFILI